MEKSPAQFDHEKLHVYRASLEFVAFVHNTTEKLPTKHRHARDQIIRASQSVLLNIAEGNSRKSGPERRRFFDIARGSAMESAAGLDILVACGGRTHDEIDLGKQLLVRIVSMLSRMVELGNTAREGNESYNVAGESDDDYEDDYDYEKGMQNDASN